MIERHAVLAGRIRQELAEVERIVSRAERAVRVAQQRPEDQDLLLDSAALNLHDFYAGLERVFEVIADGVDRVKPVGPNWHQELLHQMASEIPGVRPSVLSSEVRDRLDRYRGFRHVVRNVYTFNLDPQQVEILVRQLRPTMEHTSQELSAFADFLEQVAAK